MKHILIRLLLAALLNDLLLCDAFRLIEFELRPLTSTTFTCNENVATSIENTAENCLVNHCAEFISDVALSYSGCTSQNTVAISGGATTVDTAGTTLSETTLSVDQCIKNTLESSDCFALLQQVVPNLTSVRFISNSFPEVPTTAPVTSSTVPPISPPVATPVAVPVTSTQRPSSAPIPNPTTTVPIASPTATPSIVSSPEPSLAPTLFTKPVVALPNPSNVPSSAPVSAAPLPSPVTSIGVLPSDSSKATKDDSSSRNAAFGAVLGLSAVTAILVGYFAYTQVQKRKVTQKSTQEAIRGPLDTTDTAYEDDVEMGKQPMLLSSHPERSITNRQLDDVDDGNAASGSYLESDQPYGFSDDDVGEYEGESLVPEEDELSSGSSTLFDVNGRHDDDDGDSSVFYESPGEEDDEDEDGTDIEVTLEDTWDKGEDTTNLARDMEREDDESIQGSYISSLGASADHYGGSPSPHHFTEWIKKSPLIPAAAKASVVAAVELETLERRISSPPSPVTVPGAQIAGTRTTTDDASGWRSW